MDNNNKYAGSRNTFLIVLCIITVIAIGYGVCTHVLKLFNGKTGSIGKLGDVVSGEFTIEESFNSVSLEMNVADLTVKYGDKTTVSYTIPQKLVPAASVHNNTLTIESKGNGTSSLGELDSKKYNITITIPEGTVLKKFDVDVNLGNVKIVDIEADSMNLDADCGNIVLRGVSFEDVDLVANLGNVEMEDSFAGNVKANADCGNLETKDCTFEKIDARVNLGNLSFKAATFNKGEFKVDMGDLEVSGSFNEIKGNCNMGSIDVDTDKPESEVNIDLDVDLGSIKVNGSKWK